MRNFKKILILLTLVIIGCSVYYYTLSPLKKNLAKTKVLHWAYILNPDWEINIFQENQDYTAKLKSSTLLVDDIYKSMKGPVSYKIFRINENEDELYWITGLEIKANSEYDSIGESDDFICHVNLDHSPVEHFARMGFEERIGVQISQAINLTKGDLSFKFPKGFGYPIYSNEKIYIGSQALNLNIKNPLFTVNYDYELSFNKDKEKRLKPLYMRYAVLTLPSAEGVKKNDNIYNATGGGRVVCVIPSGENHGYNFIDENKQLATAFWLVPKGKHTYRSNFTKRLALDSIETLHKINTHVHPFATSLELRDITIDSTIFKSIITSYKDKLGLKKITSFSSEKGVKMYPDHEYELIEEVNNTSNVDCEMMASMFLYFYDRKLDKKLKNKSSELIQ